VTDPRAVLFDLAERLNEIARNLIEEDGEHEPMYFLIMPDGYVEPTLFEEDLGRPVGDRRARDMAQGVASKGATALAFVSEAWSAEASEIPKGGGPGDAANPRDILLVAAIDRLDNVVALETTVRRGADGAVELGTSRLLEDFDSSVFDLAREVWIAESYL
jgi:hypothetical protein